MLHKGLTGYLLDRGQSDYSALQILITFVLIYSIIQKEQTVAVLNWQVDDLKCSQAKKNVMPILLFCCYNLLPSSKTNENIMKNILLMIGYFNFMWTMSVFLVLVCIYLIGFGYDRAVFA